MKKSIIVSFILTSFAVFSPYLLQKDYKNTAEWSVLTQFFFLWFCVTIVIFCLDRIKSNLN